MVPDTAEISPSDAMATIMADKNQSLVGSILQIFGAIGMFAGLYFLSKSLKGDNAISSQFAEISGLLLLLVVPIWVVFMGSWVSAIDAAEQFGNEVGAVILASSTMFEMGGMLLIIGMFLLGIALIIL